MMMLELVDPDRTYLLPVGSANDCQQLAFFLHAHG